MHVSTYSIVDGQSVRFVEFDTTFFVQHCIYFLRGRSVHQLRNGLGRYAAQITSQLASCLPSLVRRDRWVTGQVVRCKQVNSSSTKHIRSYLGVHDIYYYNIVVVLWTRSVNYCYFYVTIGNLLQGAAAFLFHPADPRGITKGGVPGIPTRL